MRPKERAYAVSLLPDRVMCRIATAPRHIDELSSQETWYVYSHHREAAIAQVLRQVWNALRIEVTSHRERTAP